MKQPVEVLGLLVDIGAPVESSYVPTPPGLTVLYGLNGAGKTQLLLTLRGCLEGRPLTTSDASVAVRVTASSDPDDVPGWLRQFLANWANVEERVWTPAGVDIELDVAPIELFRRGVVDSLDTSRGISGTGIDLDRLAGQIASQGILLLGSRYQEDGHIVRIGCLANDEAPLVVAAISAERALAATSTSEDEYAISGFYDPLSGNGAQFAELADPGSHQPPFAEVHFSDQVVDGVAVAQIFTDANDVTNVGDTLLELHVAQVKSTREKDGALRRSVRKFMSEVEALAQVLIDKVLLDAPRLSIQLGDPSEWLLHRAPCWTAKPRSRPDLRLPITDLSRGEQRWATLAINLATHVCVERAEQRRGETWRQALPLFILLDEPEAHLHRSAEEYMARGLAAWAELLKAHIVVASHSPELLDLPTSKLFHVGWSTSRDAGLARSLGPPTLETLREFGLRASDLLRRQRGFVLVEGLHDQIVVEELIGEELRAARVDVLPLRGAKQLPATVDSQFLFDYTDAHVVVVLDAIEADLVRQVWQEAVALATSNRGEAVGFILESLPKHTAEHRWMREFLSKSIEREVYQRLSPFGLHAPDVIQYLPVNALVPDAHTWENLRKEHAASGSRRDFKAWLTAAKRASFTPERLRTAARSLDSVPVEFVDLANLCAGLGIKR